MLRLTDRGTLVPESYADIVIFNLDTINIAGDYLTPATPPDGIEYVLVNGKVVYTNKSHTGEKPGVVIRNKL